MEEKTLGIYIHIPFCVGKCSYCDFYSLPGRKLLMPKYQDALLRHIQESERQMEPYYIDSVYFGGGTPSHYGAKRIAELFNAVKLSGRVMKSAEVTVEVNPDSISLRDLKLLKAEGVNRISIGMQSANDEILRLIGRRHSFRQVRQAVENARTAGFNNVSLDLMYGLPSQTKGDWADTLNKAMALRPEHLSCYGLKIEPGTPICSYQGSALMPSDDDQADMYLYAVETLERYAYPQYEISNFSLRGYESRHNLKYWSLEDYMGFGPGAHSSVGNIRYSYIKSVEGYISGVGGHREMLDDYEVLDRLDKGAEYIMLGMRRNAGISKEEYSTVYRSNFRPLEKLLSQYEQKGWAVKEGERWHFTPTGFLLSNILIGALLEAQAELKASVNPWSKEAFENTVERTELPAGDEIFIKRR